jgi:thioredoxin 1
MQITMIVLGLLIAVFGIVMLVANSKMKKLPLVADNEKIIELTDKNFEQQVRNRIILVDFWAAWCAPCRMMAPVLNEIATDLSGNTYVAKVNVEQYQSLAKNFKIRGIPTMVLLKNGVEVERFVGVKSKEYLMQQIQKIKG